MHLKSLTLSGFKSFGKTTVFEFSTPVTAIVGPNGSGKSNVAESIRWVLGEQSMKSLRGKRGEDLIFNGSDKAARLGRAEVKLIFDNRKKQFPQYEFDDVVIARRVMRDGTNQYLLNGSIVRLKDIYGLLARVGLGATQHHIISQGEVDRILWASPRDRQEMIEEALGLKEFHLKKREAERKLAETEANVKQVEALRREIQPHLKYLALQTEKMRAHEDFRHDLNTRLDEYIGSESASLAELEEGFNQEKEPFEEKKRELQKAIGDLTKEVHKEEASYREVRKDRDIKEKLSELEEKQKVISRELGRVEGMLGAEKNNTSGTVSPAEFMRELKDAIGFVDDLMGKDSFESLKSGLKDIKVRLDALLKLCRGERASGGGSRSLEEKKKVLLAELTGTEQAIRSLQKEREEEMLKREDVLSELREREQKIRTFEHELEAVREKIRTIEFSEERYQERKKELEIFIRDMKHEASEKIYKPFAGEKERQSLMRAIERLRIKLEEAGGIDEGVVKEYEDTKKRDEFLAVELEDLKKATVSLGQLMAELEGTLKDRFERGLGNINEQFQVFFKQIFGGGKAELSLIKPKKIKNGEGVILDEEMTEGGIDIQLDVPRKRLRSLDMLSGGERALTSIALLFAMSAVNPPPFLVLDETDAALDEANSSRYGDLLEELAGKLQLIVITHNRQTMGRAGALYGVTMGGDGISKILSLKFEEAREYAVEGV